MWQIIFCCIENEIYEIWKDTTMSHEKTEYRNIVLISQVALSVMVPLFVCVALGVWLDGKFDTWFTIPLMVLGMLAGGRNAYVLVMSIIKRDEARRQKQLEEDIKRKVERAEQEADIDREDKIIK